MLGRVVRQKCGRQDRSSQAGGDLFFGRWNLQHRRRCLCVVSVLQILPRFWFVIAGVSMMAGVLLAAMYWKSPSRGRGIGVIAAQLAVLLSNAIARQWVQVSDLMKWYDPSKAPIRGEWGSFALFLATLLMALIVITWIGLTALRRTKSQSV